jgi:hypothetical protein
VLAAQVSGSKGRLQGRYRSRPDPYTNLKLTAVIVDRTVRTLSSHSLSHLSKPHSETVMSETLMSETLIRRP